ncbi:unnamed protein product [Linum tenue]|uniref:Remorin C-terminal domain-containing protein n=1 Tax=Linum tenue TaxID=586396 RepID=A0AAV0JYA9_9ROSI|nr:unnamed protein product [Linum tenue]
MGEEAKVSAIETSLEIVPAPAVSAAAAESQVIPVVEEKKEVHQNHQNGVPEDAKKGEAASEIEDPIEKEVHHHQKDGESSKKSAKSVPETENEAAISENTTEKTPLNPINRDAALARVETEKRNALICAWQENEKAKIDNKTYKRLASIASWENTKKVAVEAQLQEYEEQLQKKKAEYAEKMQNKLAEVHKEAEEKRAVIEATKGEEYVKIEETAKTYRATGYTPRKFFSCLGC